MAYRLHNVVCGEINNTKPNCVFGWLELKDDDHLITLQFIGNCSPDLAGRRFRFEAAHHEYYGPYATYTDPDNPPQSTADIARQQVGAVGTITGAQKVRFADCPPTELIQRIKLGEPPAIEWKPYLYLEWFSQNGRVVIELVDPLVEFIEGDSDDEFDGEATHDSEWNVDDDEDGDEFPDSGVSITSFDLSEDGDVRMRRQVHRTDAQREDEGPGFDLIPRELQEQLDREALDTDEAIVGDEASSDLDEIRLMDELMATSDGSPINEIIPELDNMPDPTGMSDEQVEAALKAVVAQMALCCVALDLCEHYSLRDAYVFLRDTIRISERIHPQRKGSQWVMHIATSDYCQTCGAEYGDVDGDETAGDSEESKPDDMPF